MTSEVLKNSILQLAIQGKLVEQRPEEGNAEALYQHIQAEKQQLIRAGKINREDPLPEIIEDEKPFDIPENWMFIRIDDIVQKAIKRGKSPTYSAFSNTLVFAQKCNSKLNGINLTLAQFLDESTLHKYPEEEFMRHMDIVVNCTGNGTLGRIGLFKDSDNCSNQKIVPDSHVTVIRVNKHLSAEYIYYFLQCNQKYFESRGDGSTKQTELKAYILRELVLPLPPFAEQKRIVAKIEELLPYIECYGQAWIRLEDFNKRFPTDMLKSVLQIAIQGKLVNQRPEEGTGDDLYKQIQAEKQRLIKAGAIKRNKSLPEITEDEKPFDVPEIWRWVRIGEITNKTTDGTHKTPSYKNEGIKFVSAKDISNGKLSFQNCRYISSEEHASLYSRCNPECGDILVSKSGSIGTVVINDYDFEFSMFESLALIKFDKSLIFPQYLRYAVQSACRYLSDKEIKGVAVKHLPIEAIVNMIIPLPPYTEQKRIVAKLEEILPLCLRLKRGE